MVKYSEKQLDGIFHALSDQTRRTILTRLAQNDCFVSELADPFKISLAAVSKHIGVLEDADLVRKIKIGRNHRCQANFASLHAANALLESLASFWEDRLQALDNFLIATGETCNETSSGKGRTKARHKKNNSRQKRKGL